MYLVARTATFARLFFLLSFSGLLMYIVLAFYTFHAAYIGISKSEKTKEALNFDPDLWKRFDKDFKYILLWTIPELKYNLTTDGQQLFIANNCSHLNCYLTTDKGLLDKDVSNFNAIVFSINTLKNWKINMPTKRSPNQKYVFYSMIAANTIPVCNVKADGFFNWTWSYKLYSDIVTPFIEVRDLTGKVTAPKYGSNWTDTIEDVETSSESTTSGMADIKDRKDVKLGNKTKAVMWYIHKCDMDRKMLTYIRHLKQALKELDLTFDIFGCGFKKCPEEGCFKALERDFYFYLAQEDSFSEDFVTTEVLKGYQHNVVPIVIGGADYAKFLPYNSYIDASHESVERLSALLHYTIRTPPAYRSYFTWRNLFTIHEVNLQRGYCDLCAMLNDKKKVGKKSVYDSFRTWWFYGPLKERCYPKGAERYEDVLSYIKTGRNNKP